MLDFLIYIGKSSIATSIFYLVFVLLFQNQKHFDFNRLYLLISLMVSFIIPLITISIVKFVDIAISDRLGSTMVYLPSTTNNSVLSVSSFSLFHYSFGAFVLGILAFSLHLIISHFKAIRIINNSRVIQLFDHPVHITSKDVHPFSFFDKIVISEKLLSSPDLEMIVSHEKIHVQEKHTIDIFLVELMFLFQWFNPFAWLIKDAVRNNLEYKTDDRITKKYNPQKYQLAMVALADKNEVSPFLTALNGSQLKNRIIMMKKKTKSKFVIAKQLASVPLLAVLVVGLSNKEARTENVQSNEKSISMVNNKKDEVVHTSLELRKAIATKIKFPVDAVDLNNELSLNLYTTISERGEITKITEQIAENEPYITAGEVVITAQRIKSDVQKSENKYKELLGKEAKRVLEDLPRIEIPEWKGKVVMFQFKFKTQ